MGTGTANEAETQEVEEDDDEQDDFGSQVSLNSSTHENDAYTDRKTGSMDRFGVVRTISKTTNGSSQSGDFVANRNIGLCNTPADPEMDHEETSRQRIRVLTSIKLLETDGVTPPLTCDAISGQRSINRRSLDQHSGQHRRTQ